MVTVASPFERLVCVVADREGELRCLGHGSGKPDDGNDLDQHGHDLRDGRTHTDGGIDQCRIGRDGAAPTPTSAASRTSASDLASRSDGPVPSTPGWSSTRDASLSVRSRSCCA